MSHQLINRSPDLKKLQDEGYSIKIIDSHLVVEDIPYLDSELRVQYGTLVSTLNLAGDKTTKPDTHVIYFIGDYPHMKKGGIIQAIKHSDGEKKLTENITVDRSFSNKHKDKPNGYDDYHQKVARYASIISAQAKAKDHTVTEKPFRVVETESAESVFKYIDTNTSRSGISAISQKLSGHKIGIIGLGGTGSYILDFIAKTPVSEIHLFDGDKLLQHNAFRIPGAISIETLKDQPYKTDYLKSVYDQFRYGIVSHPSYINDNNFDLLSDLDFIFVSMDNGEVKEKLFEYLYSLDIEFIDVGMGVQFGDEELVAQLRTTYANSETNDHISRSVSFKNLHDDAYSTNIQIAELNALNATQAVVKWKKMVGFYADYESEHESLYTVETNHLVSRSNGS
jgi:tRNA A37 threonylcarbamoyladenosine dehydratase